MEVSSPLSNPRRALLAAPDPDRYFPANTVEEARSQDFPCD